MHIDFMGRDAIIQTPQVAFTYQVTETPRDFEALRGNRTNLDWSNTNNYMGDYEVMSYGNNNDLPEIIKNVVQENYIAPGLLKRKTELLWGAGPRLYTEEVEDNRYVRKWLADKTIQRWLDRMNAEDVLLKSCVEYQHMQSVFTKFELNKGFNVSKPFVNKLEVVMCDKGRLAKLRSNKDPKATHVITTDWKLNHATSITEAKVYPIFDFNDPYAKPNAILYSSMSTFCTDYYTVPDIYGSLEWLKRSTAVPLIFKALSKNSINLKYHIVSPQEYWNKKEKEIQANCILKEVAYNHSMLLQFQEEFLGKIAKVLSGEENVGKYLHTTKSFRVDGTNLIEEGWEVKVIDQNIKDYVAAQISISERSDAALSSGINLHPVLSNTNNPGNSNSGSEQIYAVINYLNTGVDIQEMIITKAFNYALNANYPDSGVKIGFYQNVPEKQQDVSPRDRSLNNKPGKEKS